MERKNVAQDTSAILNDLERTMVASIALMKRLRRERRRLQRPETGETAEQESNT